MTQHQLRALRAFYSRRLGRFTAPTATAFFKVLVALDRDVLDRAARTWAAQHSRGVARQDPHGKHHLVAAVEHRSGNVLGQEAVAHKSNEIPTVRSLAIGLDLQGLDWERPEVCANRLHHVRDVSYDEHRCRVRTGHLPRNLACLTNLAISIVRIQGRFDFLPQAHRHYARRPQNALGRLLESPKR